MNDEFTLFIAAVGAAVVSVIVGAFYTLNNTDTHIANAIKAGTPALVAKCAFRDAPDCKLIFLKDQQ